MMNDGRVSLLKVLIVIPKEFQHATEITTSKSCNAKIKSINKYCLGILKHSIWPASTTSVTLIIALGNDTNDLIMTKLRGVSMQF